MYRLLITRPCVIKQVSKCTNCVIILTRSPELAFDILRMASVTLEMSTVNRLLVVGRQTPIWLGDYVISGHSPSGCAAGVGFLTQSLRRTETHVRLNTDSGCNHKSIFRQFNKTPHNKLIANPFRRS